MLVKAQMQLLSPPPGPGGDHAFSVHLPGAGVRKALTARVGARARSSQRRVPCVWALRGSDVTGHCIWPDIPYGVRAVSALSTARCPRLLHAAAPRHCLFAKRSSTGDGDFPLTKPSPPAARCRLGAQEEPGRGAGPLRWSSSPDP